MIQYISYITFHRSRILQVSSSHPKATSELFFFFFFEVKKDLIIMSRLIRKDNIHRLASKSMSHILHNLKGSSPTWHTSPTAFTAATVKLLGYLFIYFLIKSKVLTGKKRTVIVLMWQKLPFWLKKSSGSTAISCRFLSQGLPLRKTAKNGEKIISKASWKAKAVLRF